MHAGSALGAVLNAGTVARADQSLASPRCPLWPTGRRWASRWPIRRLSAVTFDAVEPDAETAIATLRSDNPRAASPRWVVAEYPFTTRGVTMRESARKNRVRCRQTAWPR